MSSSFSFGMYAPLSQRIPGLSTSIKSPAEGLPVSESKSLSRDRLAAYYGMAQSSRYQFLPWLDDVHGETIEHLNAYMEMYRRDDCVQSAVNQKVWAVATLDWRVHASTKSPRSKMIADFLLDNYRQTDGGTTRIVEELLIPMLIRKFVVAEIRWRKEPVREGRWKGKRVLRDLVARELATYEEDGFGNITAILGPDEEGAEARFDPKHFVVLKNKPVYGIPASDMRPVYRWFIAKDTIIKLWLICLEKFGTPFPVAKYPSGAEDERIALERVVAGLTGRTGAVLPNGSEIDFLDALSSTANFENALDRCDKGIMLAINGAFLQSLTSQTSGDRGNSLVQKETSELPVWRLSEAIKDAINNQVSPKVIKQNFTHAETPRTSLGAVNVAEMVKMADLDAKLLANGIDQSIEEAHEKYSVVPPKDDKDSMLAAMKAAKPAPPPSPFGGAGGPFGGPPKGNPPPDGSNNPNDGFQPGADQEDAGDAEEPVQFADVLDAGIPEPEEPVEAKLVRILGQAEAGVKRTLRNVAASAVKRILSGDKGRFFSEAEKADLAMAITDVIAPAELLGRIGILERARQAVERHAIGSTAKFSDIPTDLYFFDDLARGFEATSPRKVLEYFRRLYPSLDLDPDRFGPMAERHAMTLAAATEQTLVNSVQDLIDERIETGQGIGNSEADIDELLAGMGVSGPTPNYAETVFRTNMMDAYNAGSYRQLAESKDMFPVYMYSNPDDGRSRKSHADRNGKYYPSDVPFVLVRGLADEDIFNCRCTPIPIDKWEWEDLQAQGKRAEEVGEEIHEFAWTEFTTARDTIGAVWDTDRTKRLYGEAARKALQQQNGPGETPKAESKPSAPASEENSATAPPQEEMITLPKKKLQQIVNGVSGRGQDEGMAGRDTWAMVQKEHEKYQKQQATKAAEGTIKELKNKNLTEALFDADYFATPVYSTLQTALNVSSAAGVSKGDAKSQGSIYYMDKIKDTVYDSFQDASREFGRGPAFAITTVYTGLLMFAGMPLLDKVLPKWAYALVPLGAGAAAFYASFGAARAIKSIYNGAKNLVSGTPGTGEEEQSTPGDAAAAPKEPKGAPPKLSRAKNPTAKQKEKAIAQFEAATEGLRPKKNEGDNDPMEKMRKYQSLPKDVRRRTKPPSLVARFADEGVKGFFDGLTPDVIISGVRKMAESVAKATGDPEPILADAQILEFFDLTYSSKRSADREAISKAIRQAGAEAQPPDIFSDWDESKINRDEAGKFAKGTSSPRGSNDSLEYHMHGDKRRKQLTKEGWEKRFPKIPMEEAGRLLGAGPAFTVRVTGETVTNGFGIQAELFKDGRATTLIGEIRAEKEGLTCYNRSIMTSVTGTGLGTQMFKNQIEACSVAGVDRIVLTALREPGYNGYLTWPKFGFDCDLPWSVRLSLPGLGAKVSCKRLSDLLEKKWGWEWWEKHGSSLPMDFDLSPNSRSIAKFNSYLEKKGLDTVKFNDDIPGADDDVRIDLVKTGPVIDEEASKAVEAEIQELGWDAFIKKYGSKPNA